MAILHYVKPEGNHLHVCEPPESPEKKYGRGTVWECEGCGRQAQLNYDEKDGWVWSSLEGKDYFPRRQS